MGSRKYTINCFFAVFVLLSWAPPGFSQYTQEDSNYTSLFVDGRECRYILYVPDGYTNKALPLIIVLHGGLGTGQKMRKVGFDAYARRYGFAVAYPDAYTSPGARRPGNWNDGRETIESYRLGIDDVHFIRAMIDDIARRITLDRARIYVTGSSNGGMMSYRLAIEATDIFAAVAPVIANIPLPFYGKSTPSSGISILTISGTDDPLMPFNGGNSCATIRSPLCDHGPRSSHEGSIEVFAKSDGCSLNYATERLASIVDDGTWIEKQTFTGCNGHYEVISYIVHGGGHTWPPYSGRLRVTGHTSGNLNATKEIVEFFMRHSKS